MRKRLLVGAGAALGGYWLLQRLGKRWGASDEEVNALLPGDELVPDPIVQTTHAVSIHARAMQVWPWLAQMGYGRAQWYTDAWWDPLIEKFILPISVPAQDLPPEGVRPSANRIIPELQDLKAGDIVPDGPPGTAYFIVHGLQPGEFLTLLSDTHTNYIVPTFLDATRLATHGQFSWAFVLQEHGPAHTRLILRMRATLQPRWVLQAGLPLIYLADFLFVRQMLLGIKMRVEKQSSRA